MSQPQTAPRLYPTFRYRDPNAALAWLTDIIGFTVLARYDDAEGRVSHAELAYGPSLLMLGHAAEDAFGSLVGAPGEQGGKAIYLAVDDVDGLFAKVRASGVEIAEGLTDRSYGSREFICRDPEGNVWCFGTYRPAAP
jgi:uncharacterized glyoxalase superfamily protein PhnB